MGGGEQKMEKNDREEKPSIGLGSQTRKSLLSEKAI